MKPGNCCGRSHCGPANVAINELIYMIEIDVLTQTTLATSSGTSVFASLAAQITSSIRQAIMTFTHSVTGISSLLVSLSPKLGIP